MILAFDSLAGKQKPFWLHNYDNPASKVYNTRPQTICIRRTISIFNLKTMSSSAWMNQNWNLWVYTVCAKKSPVHGPVLCLTV